MHEYQMAQGLYRRPFTADALVLGTLGHPVEPFERRRPVGPQLQKPVPQVGRIREWKLLRIGFDKKIERIEHLEIGKEINDNGEFGGLFGKDETRQPIAVRILLPVHEVIARRDRERVARHARATMRRRPQTDHLRAEVDWATILVARGVMETDQDRHRTLPRELFPGASLADAPKCESPFIGQDRSMLVQFSDRNTWKGRHKPASLRVEASLRGAALSLRPRLARTMVMGHRSLWRLRAANALLCRRSHITDI